MAQDWQTDCPWKVVPLFLGFSITKRQDFYLEHGQVKVLQRRVSL